MRHRDPPALPRGPIRGIRRFKLHGALVSGTILHDAGVIKAIKKNRALVLSLDSAKPVKDHESVWLICDLMSGITLGAHAMRSCTATALAKLLSCSQALSRRRFSSGGGIINTVRRVSSAGRHS